MKTSFLAVAVFLGLFLNSGVASAAEKAGSISNDLLAQVGLARMEIVSDAEGMQIRGKGFKGHGDKHHGGHHGGKHHGGKHHGHHPGHHRCK